MVETAEPRMIAHDRTLEAQKPGLDEYYLAVAFAQSEKLPDNSSQLKVNLRLLRGESAIPTSVESSNE